MSAVIHASPHHSVRIGWLPWTGETLGAWLAGIGVLGLLSIVLALAGRMRGLMFLFCAALLWLAVRGFFLSNWQFGSAANLRLAIIVTVGLLAALAGSVPLSKRDR